MQIAKVILQSINMLYVKLSVVQIISMVKEIGFQKNICTRIHVYQTWSILTDCLPEVFGRTKLHKKKRIQKYIYFFLLKKVIAILRAIFQYCISNFHVKYCSVLSQYQKMDLKIAIIFKVNKQIFLDNSLCNFVRPKTSDKLSVNIDHV